MVSCEPIPAPMTMPALNGRNAKPGLDRRVQQDALQVVGQEQEDREQAGTDQQADHVGPRPVAVLHDPHRQQRAARLQLDQHERGQQHDRNGHPAQGVDRTPAVFGRLGAGPDQRAETGGGQHGARDVVVRAALDLGFRAAPGWPRSTAMMATGMFTNRHQRQDAYSVSTPPSSRPIAAPPPVIAPNTANALARSLAAWKVTVTSDSAAGASIAAKRALEGAGDEQLPADLRGAADGRGDGEAGQRDDQDLLAADIVGDPAAEQQQRTERQGIGGHHPLPVGVGDAQRGLRLRQRDVHDGRVQDDHQLREGDDRQREPAFRVEREVVEIAPFSSDRRDAFDVVGWWS